MPAVPALVDPWLPAVSPIPLSRPATPIVVSKYDPDNTSTPFTILTNVVCVSIGLRIGANPPTARFRYEFGTGDPEAPQSFEQALSTDATLMRLVDTDDRIVVHAQQPDEAWAPVFYGYALGFHLSLEGNRESVYFDAIGAVKDAWNSPIDGVLWRDAGKATDAAADDIPVDLPGHFNPHGKPNCIPALGWNKDDFNAFPVFLDTSNPKAEFWDLPGAARYLIFRHLEADPIDHLDVPEGDYLDDLLISKEPIEGSSKFFDPDDPTTYNFATITVADLPIDAKPWPSVLEHMIGDKGFAMAWEVTSDAGDAFTLPEPRHFLNVFRPQSDKDGHGRTNEPKQIWLQPRGSVLDLAYTNFSSANVSRDVSAVVNRWDVLGQLEEVEISVILDLGFATTGTMPTDLTAFTKGTNQALSGTNFNKYRLFVADESGEGHYHAGSSTKLTTPLNLDDVFGVPVDPTTGEPLTADPTTGEFDPSGIRQYAYRRRPTLGDLLTKDDRGQPYKAKLSYSTDYAGTAPGLWDHTGTWFPIAGSYKVLPDRIGIYVDCENPNAWTVGPKTVLKVIECIENPSAVNKRFHLMLTCKIYGDKRVRGTATKDAGDDLLRETVKRTVEARDRYRKQTVAKCSEFSSDGEHDAIVRDDTANATAEANAMQQATQGGVMSGPIVIPRFTAYYKIGDRIDGINGRALGFRTDGNSDAEPIYPVVEGITWNLDGGQTTTLHLSDANTARTSYARRLKPASSRRHA